MGQTIELLENALRAWEDLCLFEEARVRLKITDGRCGPQELRGPTRHWRELRDHLRMIRGGDFDSQRFMPTEEQMREGTCLVGKRNMFEFLPMQLASWTLSSRRVFQLGEDLIDRFLAADYSNYTWADLLWPFDSFAIELDKWVGMRREDKMIRFPLILVTSNYGLLHDETWSGGEDTFELGIFFTATDDDEHPTECYPQKDRDRLAKHLQHRRWDKLQSQLMKITKWLVDHAESNDRLRLPAGADNPLFVKKHERLDQLQGLGKVIAGLCLYLEALPAGTVENYGWKQSSRVNPKRELRNIITDGEQVCRVEDFNVISPDTITLFPETLRKGPAYTVTPHWRRAHYRRKRGQGHNPDAPRDVLVRPALIHKDQLPEGSVPGGSISRVR